MNNSNVLTVDLKEPWGVSPVTFGFIQIAWAIVCFAFYLMSALSGKSNFSLALIIAALPLFSLIIYKMRREANWGWLITAVSNAASSNRMIEDSRPVYRTIFGYNRRETAPTFKAVKLGQDRIKLTVNTNGCPNADVDLTSALQRELSGWSVVPQSQYPICFLLTKKRNRGRRVTNEDFFSSRQ